MSDSDSWQTPQWLFDELDEEFHFDIDLCATKENSKCHVFAHNYLKNEYVFTRSNQHVFTYGSLNSFIEDTYKTPEEHRSAFMNPPYSNPRTFIEKAWEDSKHCKIVCLVKCDPSTRWWATFWNYGEGCPYCSNDVVVFRCAEDDDFCGRCHGGHNYNGPKPGCEVRFFPKRIKFDPPQGIDLTCDECAWDRKFMHIVQKYPVEQCELYRSSCKICKGTGKKKLSGPTFPSALVIMDRRHV